MSRLAWILLAVILLALAAYVLWPQPTAPKPERIFSGAIPTTFRLVAGGQTQEVSGGTVRNRGLVLPADPERITALWRTVENVQAETARIQVLGSKRELAAFGIDPEVRALTTDGLGVSWGVRGGHGYVADLKRDRVFPVAVRSVEILEKSAARLDRRLPLSDAGQAAKVQLAWTAEGTKRTLIVARAEHFWLAQEALQRPDFAARVRRLLGYLARVELADLAGVEASGAPELELTLTIPAAAESGKAIAEPPRVVAVRLLPGDVLRIDALPGIRLDPANAQALRTAVASFGQDFPYAIQLSDNTSVIDRAVFRRAGKELLRLERKGRQDSNDTGSTWQVTWPGGQARATSRSGEVLARALNSITVEGVRLIKAAVQGDAHQEPRPAAALSLECNGELPGGRCTLTWMESTRTFWSDDHVGRVDQLPEVLQRASPDDFLDPRLVERPTTRVVRLQRQFHDGAAPRGERFDRQTGGRWRQTFPTDASGGANADAEAVSSLVRAVGFAVGSQVRLSTAEDRVILDKPAFELDIRFSAQVQRRAANDDTREEETATVDAGWAFAKVGDAWFAVSKLDGITWRLDEDQLDTLRRSVADPLAFPVVPGQILALEITRGGQQYFLDPVPGNAWKLRLANGSAEPADAVAVRRLLRALAMLRASAVEVDAPAVPAWETDATVVASLPAVGGGIERRTLAIGKIQGESRLTSVDSTRPTPEVPRGRRRIAASDLDAVCPDPQALRARAIPAGTAP